MSERIMFRDWAPDLPALANRGETVATNVRPRTVGYGPMPSLSSIGETPLAEYARGALATIDYAGNAHNFAGTQSKLYVIDANGTQDVSKSGGYSATNEIRWASVIRDEDVFFAQLRDPLQFFNLRTSSLFADVSDDAPRAKHIGVVGRHLILGHTYDNSEGLVPHRIWWPSISNPFSWPTPGSATALSAQAGRHDLGGEGGWVMSVVGGSEFGVLFQERAITRMDYRGGDVMYQFTTVDTTRGLLIPDLAVPIGRRIFYLAEDGFYFFDQAASVPIGDKRINRTFLNDLDRTYMDRVSWMLDPDAPYLYIAYPVSGNTGGNPNRILVYDWQNNRFSQLSVEVELLSLVLTPGVTLDTLPYSNIDTMPGSLDDRQSDVGALTIGAFDTSHDLSTFTGDNLAATIETGDRELAPGRWSLTGHIMPLVTGADPTVTVGSRPTQEKAITWGTATAKNTSGYVPTRKNSRYHRFRLSIPSDSAFEAVGLDVDSVPTGRR
jgi:hypothetical protein